MNCAEFEILLADYIDDALPPSERSSLEQHASSCRSCREFMADATAGLSFLGRAEDVSPPAELITRIAYQAPLGRTRQPFERQGLFSKLTSKWLQPLLQPRLAMGMAMTVLSFAMLEKCTGVQVQHIQPSDLSPIHVWSGVEDRAVRVKDRAVKYYENLRVVYQVGTLLRDIQEQQQQPERGKPNQAHPSPNSSPAKTGPANQDQNK